MKTIDEFKEFLQLLLRLDDLQDGDKFTSRRDSTVVYEYREEDIVKLLSYQSSYNLSKTSLYAKSYFEVPVEIGGALSFRNRFNGDIELESKGKIGDIEIKYKLNNISKEYFLISLMSLYDEIRSSIDRPESVSLKSLLRSRVFWPFRRTPPLQKVIDDDVEPDKGIIEFILMRLGFSSLKIEAKKPISFEEFERLKNSFIFEYMYNTTTPLNEYQNFKMLYRLLEYQKIQKKLRTLLIFSLIGNTILIW